MNSALCPAFSIVIAVPLWLLTVKVKFPDAAAVRVTRIVAPAGTRGTGRAASDRGASIRFASVTVWLAVSAVLKRCQLPWGSKYAVVLPNPQVTGGPKGAPMTLLKARSGPWVVAVLPAGTGPDDSVCQHRSSRLW